MGVAVFNTTVRCSAKTPLPIRKDELADQVEVGEGKGGERAGRVFQQSSVSYFCEAPELLHDAEGMLSPRSCSRAALVDLLLMLGQRAMVRAASVHPISHATREKPLPIRLFPVRLISEDLTLRTMKQRLHLRDVGGGRMGRAQTVHHTAPIGSHVHLHPEVPRVPL